MNKGIIVYIYNSFGDPLFQNLMLRYIQSLSGQGRSFYLFTFEQPQYALSADEQSKTKALLREKGIHWHPFRHRTGRYLLLKKLIDLLSVSFTIFRLKVMGKVDSIFAFANVAASQSVIYSLGLGLDLYIYSYEPHAEFLAELGLWEKSGLKYKTLNYFERLAAKKAKVVFTGTRFGVELIHSINPNTKAIRLPTSVDENDFYYREAASKQWRTSNQAIDRPVVLYIGKFGDLYYPMDKLISFYEALYALNKHYLFVIVTSLDMNLVDLYINKSVIPRKNFIIDQNIDNEMVKVLISAADVGMSIVPPMENQKYRSPTKVAEYLLCGLPYVTCKGVSEDDLVAIKEGVGVVIDDLDGQYASEVNQTIIKWRGNRESIRKKCRAVGVSYRGMSNVDKKFREVF